MKRSEALAPLSRDHHVALEVALRLRRGEDGAADRFAAYFAEHGRRHFDREEALLLEHLDPEDAERLLADHRAIAAPVPDDPEALRALGERLHDHVRWEERELFVKLEARLAPDELAAISEGLG